MEFRTRYIFIIAFIFFTVRCFGQKRSGYFGGKIYIGVEESITPFGLSEDYTLVNRGFGRIKLEKQIGRNLLLGLNAQKQVFRVNDISNSTLESNAYAVTLKLFNKRKNIAPVGNHKVFSLMYTENHFDKSKVKFGDLSVLMEIGKSIPFIFPKLLFNISLSGRLRLYDSEAIDPFAQYDLFYDDTKFKINEFIWTRNIVKLNFGLMYAL